MAVRRKKDDAGAGSKAGFTMERLLTTASLEVLEHGRELVDAPVMLKRLKDGNELSCVFYMEGRQIRCSVDSRRHSLQDLCTCDAPYFCRHSAALVLTWLEHPGTFLDLEQWLDGLRDRPKDELVAMLRHMIGRYPASSLEALRIPGFDPSEVLEQQESEGDDLLPDLLDLLPENERQTADPANAGILPGWAEEIDEEEDDDRGPGTPGKPIN
jgi:hypothetical protein